MTDQQQLAPSHQQLAALTRSEPKRVTGKLAEAVQRMIERGEPWDDAARNVGLTSRAMRLALSKPHVIAHLKREKQIARERLSAANIYRLAQIRDAADNMPAVNAIKVLEQLGDDGNSSIGSRSSQLMPGVTIHIHAAPSDGTQPQHVRHIDAKPLITLDRDSLHENVTP